MEEKNNAIVIFEHLSDNAEEKELANHGILLWGNHNHNFGEMVMGYHEDNKSDFQWASYLNRTWQHPHIVGYMESHDEERIMFKALTYGNVGVNYSVKQKYNALKRAGAAAVFLLSVPGPKMIWQFGELGYDVSIDEGGRLGKKPPRWEYQNDPDRAQLYKQYADIIQLRKTEPVFSTSDFTLNVGGSVKYIALNYADNDVRLVGNFDMEIKTVTPGFSSTGWWYNHFNGDSLNVTSLSQQVSIAPGKFYLYSQKKMPGFEVLSSVLPGAGQAESRSMVFPNPVNNRVTVRAEEAIQEVVVFDVNGKTMGRFLSSGFETTLPTSHWQRGIYVVQILYKDGVSENHKIVK